VRREGTEMEEREFPQSQREENEPWLELNILPSVADLLCAVDSLWICCAFVVDLPYDFIQSIICL